MLVQIFLPAIVGAQTYEVLHPGLFYASNSWTFDSEWAGNRFTTTWQVTTATAGILRETTPYYRNDMTVSLNQVAMMITKVDETRLTSPTQQVVAEYSDPLEKIPRFVHVNDNKTSFGYGVSQSHIGGTTQTQTWTRTQEQKVTFLGQVSVTVPAGTFDCIAIRVDETWQFDNDWYGKAEREYWLNRPVGPIKMVYKVWDYDPDGDLYSYSMVSHKLNSFSPALPDLIADQTSLAPNPVEWGQNLTLNWREMCRYQNTSKGHRTNVYLSTDTTISVSDIVLVNSLQIPQLNKDQTYPASTTTLISRQIPPGSYYVGIVVDSRNEVAEFDEVNTFTLPTKLTVMKGPDLTVLAGSFSPSTLAPGTTLTVTGTVVNAGDTTAQSSWTHVYLSADARITTSDYLLASGIQTSVLPLAGSYSFQVSRIVPAWFADGQYFVGIICDVDNAVREGNEENNATPLGTVFVTPPDLTISAGAFSPSMLGPGTTLTVTGTVMNIGATTAPSSWAHVYLSADALITTSDYLLASGIQTSVLPSSGSYPFRVSRIVPTSFPDGHYFVGIICDVDNAVSEANEQNNAIPLWPRVFIARADLAVSGGIFSPTMMAPGDVLSTTWTIQNIGGTTAPSTLASLYLSTDTVIGANDFPLVTGIDIPSLSPSSQIFIGRSVRVPSDFTQGRYHVGIVADVGNRVNEMNEQNNSAATSNTVFIAFADWEVTYGNFAPSLLVPGNTLNTTWTIRNIGSPAPATLASVYISTDTLIGPNDFPLIANIDVPPLASSVQVTIRPSALLPSGFVLGWYRVGIVVDVENRVTEMNEQNNVLIVSKPLGVGGPDLYMTRGQFSPMAVRPGQQLAVQATVKNVGILPATTSSLSVYLSSDDVITTSDTLLQAGLRCPALAADAVFTVNALPSIPATTPLGRYRVGVICDAAGEVVEADERNNPRALSGTLTVAKPDLLVDRLDFAPNVVKSSDTIRLAGSIVNASMVETGSSFWLQFLVSPNADFSPPRFPVCESVRIPTLLSSGTFSLAALERTILPSAPVGEFTFGVVVDGFNEVSESNEANNAAWVSARKIYIGVKPTRLTHWSLYR